MPLDRSTRQYSRRWMLAIVLAALITAVLWAAPAFLQWPAIRSTSDHASSVSQQSNHLQELDGQVLVDFQLDGLSNRQSDDDPFDSNPPSDDDPSDDDDDDDDDNDEPDDDDIDPDEEWRECVNRGCKLNELMKRGASSLEDRYKTRWTNFDDIQKYGWSLSKEAEKVKVNKDERTSAEPALRALGIPGLDDPSWKKVPWKHIGKTTIGGKTYPATEGEFTNIYNPSYGIIIAASNHSPQKQDHHLPADQIVPLGRWSDITYLTWVDVCNIHHQDPSNLKYILRINIISSDAPIIMSRISGIDLADFTAPYPGFTIGQVPDSENARAAVGYSNGRGVAWLLIQHKETFGDTRYIKDMKFWDSYNGNRPANLLPGLDEIPNMLFTLS